MADNAAYAYNYLRRRGLTPAQAAGAVGGLSGESGRGLSTTAVNPNSGAYGAGQWLGARKSGLMAMPNHNAIKTQMDYLWKELQGSESGAFHRLKGAHTIADATRAWVEGFERPSPREIAQSMPTRLSNARDFFSKFSGRPVTSSGGGLASSAGADPSGLLGMSAATQGTTGNDRLATLASVMQRLEAATPHIPYNSPLSRADDPQGDSKTTFEGAPKSSLAPFGSFQSTFQPTQVQSMQPTSLGDMLASLASVQGSSAPPAPGGVSPLSGSAGSQSTGGLVGGKGEFHITGPNPGRVQPVVSSFMRRVADVYGHPITASDGSGHSLRTTTGNISEHSTGMAVDNPARGRQLVAMGQAALIAAGMPAAQARKQNGGLYNVYGKDGTRYQIIFNVNDPKLGGNHTDHLHVGVKPGRRR